MKNFIFRMINVLSILLFTVILFGCGFSDNSKKGTVTLGKTSITVETNITNLDSDLAKWTDVDKDGFICGEQDLFTVEPDDIDVIITSIPIFTLPEGTLLPHVRVESVTIVYTAANSQNFPISPLFQTMGILIPPKASTTIPVRVTTHEMKMGFTQKAHPCSIGINTYHVALKFKVSETEPGGKSGTVETNLTIRITDFGDDEGGGGGQGG